MNTASFRIYTISFITLSFLQFSCQSFVNSLKETKDGAKVPAQELSKDSVAERPVAGVPQGKEVQQDRSPESDFLADTVALQAAEDALRNRPELKGHEIFIYRSVHFYDDYRITLKIRHPENVNYVDAYDYRKGKWSEPSPVVLSKRDVVSKDIVSLERLPFKNANRVHGILKEKLQSIASRSEDYTVYAITSNNRIKWYPRTISNDRSKYSMEFNEDGSLRLFEQN